MYGLLCFAMLVLLVAATKIHFRKQVLVAGTKQSRQANKTGRPIRQAGHIGSLVCQLCFWGFLGLFELVTAI
jgi:hypothetical protein